MENDVRAHNFKDITGQKFGRLTVVEFAYKGKGNRAVWRCVCDCGNVTYVPGKSLRSGNTKSCGCMSIDHSTERIVALNTTHGLSDSRIYRVWNQIHRRCEYEKSVSWQYYGGKGVTVCDEWKDFEQFCDWAMENGYEDGLTIDRIDYNKGYSPENCRWVSYHDQAANRSSTRLITCRGLTMCKSDWTKALEKKRWWLDKLTDEEAVEKIERERYRLIKIWRLH